MAEFTTKQRENLADKDQAMPDGSFPIRNRSDLKNAIKAYGRAKDKAAAKRWIMKRARELDAEDLIPDIWKSKNEVEHSDDEFMHYGVLGMKWGVRHNPSKAYRKSSQKADKLAAKVDKKSKKASKTNAKAEKVARRKVSFGLQPSNEAVARRAKNAARAQKKYEKATKKQNKWLANMKKEFQNVSVSEISSDDLSAGQNYIEVLRKR